MNFYRDGKKLETEMLDYSKLKSDPDLMTSNKFNFSVNDHNDVKNISIHKLEALKSRLDLAYNSVVIAINRYNDDNINTVREDLIGLHKMIATVLGGEISIKPIISNTTSVDISDDDQKNSLTEEDKNSLLNDLLVHLNNDIKNPEVKTVPNLLESFIKDLNLIKDDFNKKFYSAKPFNNLVNLKNEFLGKQSKISVILSNLDSLNEEEKGKVGDVADDIINYIEFKLNNGKTMSKDDFGKDKSGLGSSSFDDLVTEDNLNKARKLVVKDSLKKTKLFFNKKLSKLGLNELAEDLNKVVNSIEDVVDKKM